VAPTHREMRGFADVLSPVDYASVLRGFASKPTLCEACASSAPHRLSGFLWVRPAPIR
jgi:hypothetical protein